MLTDDWMGCYREGWGSRLRPASYAHPAKNSYGLSVRIYEHALEQGWVKPGDYVVDCFSGVGGFALEALRHGLHFRGVELEQRFVDMGQGCDCTGISKADWVHYQGRWDRMRYEGGRHWCPQCLAEAKEIEHDRGQLRMFARAPTASYVRNSGKIPCTGAHRYHGNIETWEAQGMPGSALIVQGDSRRLGEVLERASLCLSSPPYANSIQSGGDGIDWSKIKGEEGKPNRSIGRGAIADGYGQAEGNLGNETSSTFWAASREILEEVYKVLAPGGHAIFVCKRFVRAKKIVDFPLQWAHLCEAVGFTWIHHHKAWLVEDRGAQHTLEGGLEKREVRRLSFFRRLHTQKYPHLAILWEDVLCFVKEPQ